MFNFDPQPIAFGNLSQFAKSLDGTSARLESRASRLNDTIPRLPRTPLKGAPKAKGTQKESFIGPNRPDSWLLAHWAWAGGGWFAGGRGRQPSWSCSKPCQCPSLKRLEAGWRGWLAASKGAVQQNLGFSVVFCCPAKSD